MRTIKKVAIVYSATRKTDEALSKVKEIMALSGICVSTKIKGEFKR